MFPEYILMSCVWVATYMIKQVTSSWSIFIQLWFFWSFRGSLHYPIELIEVSFFHFLLYSFLNSLPSLLLPFHGATAPSGPRPPHYRGFTIVLRRTTLVKTPLEEWPTRHRDLYLTNTQLSQETEIYVPGGIRTRNPNKRATADPRLRPRDHWDSPWPKDLKFTFAQIWY